ncbi:hypothetical protein [Haladaptatus litoreus]|nr:hypothetical protein [Haladaptatus litoreus]
MRFHETFDWEPSYPTYREGIQNVVEAWREAGTLVERPDGYEWREN